MTGVGDTSGKQNTGFNMGTFISKSNESITAQGGIIEAAMENIYDSEGKVDPGKLVNVQFKIGQYNTIVESISSVTKSITESMKSIAQRAT